MNRHDSRSQPTGETSPQERMAVGPFQKQLEAARDRVLRVGTTDVPPGRHARAMANRLVKHGAAYFTFVTTPGVEPTNNVAEQAVRFVAIDWHITYGTQGRTRPGSPE